MQTSPSHPSMKLHYYQFPRVFREYHAQPADGESQPAASAVLSKRLRSLAPTKMDKERYPIVASCDLKSFIKPPYTDEKGHPSSPSPQVETHTGGTRWNPTHEQIGILEMLYEGGMRTPNAHQIEQIAEKLAKYGKIEGKNVFYWFQNHKARERQRQKRERLGDPHLYYPRTPRTLELSTASRRNNITTMSSSDNNINAAKEDHVREGAQKRRCRSWTLDHSADEEPTKVINNCSCRSDDEGSISITLQLFPLHPEGRNG